MLLSLVVVAVKITSDTVACFFFSSLSLFLVALSFRSIKQSQYQCKKYEKKEKQSEGAESGLTPSSNHTWRRFSETHENQVFAQFAQSLLNLDCQKHNQESIVFRSCFGGKKKPSCLCYQTHFYFSLPLLLLFNSFLSLLPHPLTPPQLQAMLESALKHWSGVKCYVALDGSG